MPVTGGMPATVGGVPSVVGGLQPPALAPLGRSDPNTIFSALTRRMGELELNQSLINNWLTLWQNQIVGKIKTLNATHEEAQRRLRGLQANVSATQLSIANLSATTGPGLAEQVAQHARLLDDAVALNNSVGALETRLFDMLAVAQQNNQRLRHEVEMLQVSHRIELLCCMLLSLGLSWLVAANCIVPPRRLPPRKSGSAGPNGSSSSSGGRPNGVPPPFRRNGSSSRQRMSISDRSAATIISPRAGPRRRLSLPSLPNLNKAIPSSSSMPMLHGGGTCAPQTEPPILAGLERARPDSGFETERVSGASDTL